ncbi:TraB/GumN family protein [Spirochaeta isovalerica]|uniref:Pheromone shutdown-related protein TraB n=1 Tax=Spirochaeta isovalerica TaxID=150 RepID=A0A841REG7_9SPIO|nr:TraB/GumN family protein [Spirochaeta isovalerica]MBB6482383.1 pheromone shutdown-related protein TraB [Spirochaeta isovalerica]
MKIDNISDTINRIVFDDREILLIGTAHVSHESVDEVKQAIESEEPGRVCIEIDEGRYQSIIDEESWKKLDIHQAIRQKKGFLMIASLILGSFQKKIGADMGIRPGEEMKIAAEAATEKGIPFSFSDRPIQITLQRAWRKSNLWNKMKLLSSLIASAFTTEKVEKSDIEELKNSNALQGMMEELAGYLPSVKEVLIDERDRYLATNIFNTTEKKVVAVVGAGHGPGILKWFERLDKKEVEADISDISVVPPKRLYEKAIPWIIPFVIVGIITAGFFTSGVNAGFNMILVWILANGIPAALGAIIAAAHPLTIIISFAAAPITSMNPTIGVGFVSGLLESSFRKPRIRDLENLQDDAGSLKGWYGNRVLRILLVFLLSSLGSAIGTWWAIPHLSILLGS